MTDEIAPLLDALTSRIRPAGGEASRGSNGSAARVRDWRLFWVSRVISKVTWPQNACAWLKCLPAASQSVM